MSDATDVAVRDLAAKWRHRAAGQGAIYAQALSECADELEAMHSVGAKCDVCRAKGLLPSQAIACALHSTHAIRELEATVAALRDTAGAGGRLHVALAEFQGCIPSADGVAELEAVKEDRARLDRVRAAIEAALAIANYEDVIGNSTAETGR